MAHPIPLVRAAALGPFLLWMRARGLSIEARLADAGLPANLIHEPERPIALVSGARFLVAASRSLGPDLSCRVVSDTSIVALATLGRVALGASDPRGAIARLVRAYRHHSSHEHFVVTPTDAGLIIRHSFQLPFDDETLHCCQQYVAAMVRALLAGTGNRRPRLAAVSMVPHPQAGLGHLADQLDVEVRPAVDRTLSITLSDAVIDQPYLRPARARGTPNALSPIRGDGTLAGSLRAILPGLLETAPPTIADIASLAGTSPRSLQRRLAAEGFTVSGLIDEIRRAQALDRLRGSDEPVGAISAELGYTNQSSLSRAMRRWADTPPSRLRGR